MKKIILLISICFCCFLTACSFPFFKKEEEPEVVETYTLFSEYTKDVRVGETLEKDNIRVYLKNDNSEEEIDIEDYDITNWSDKVATKSESWKITYENYTSELVVDVINPISAETIEDIKVYEGFEDELESDIEINVIFEDGYKEKINATLQTLYVNTKGKNVDLTIKARVYGTFDIIIPYIEIAGVDVQLKTPIELNKAPEIEKISLKYWDNTSKEVDNTFVDVEFPDELTIGENSMIAKVLNKTFIIPFYIEEQEEVLSDPEFTEITGDMITWIGDSYSVGAQELIESKLPGVDIYAKVSKHFQMDAGEDVGGPSGISILRQIIDRGELRPVLVFALGTNDPIQDSNLFSSYIDEVVKLAGNSTIILTTPCTKTTTNYSGTVKAMRDAAEKYSNVRLADWKKFVDENTEKNYFSSDNAHLNSEGMKEWLNLVIRQLN